MTVTTMTELESLTRRPARRYPTASYRTPKGTSSSINKSCRDLTTLDVEIRSDNYATSSSELSGPVRHRPTPTHHHTEQ